MAILMTIKGTADEGAEAVEALCARRGYKAEVTNPDYDPDVEGSLGMIDNPETASKFAKRMVIEYIKGEMKAYDNDKKQALVDKSYTGADGITIE